METAGREEFYELAGRVMTAGAVRPDRVSEFVKLANGAGNWSRAFAALALATEKYVKPDTLMKGEETMEEKNEEQGLTVTWATRYLDPESGRECEIRIGNGDGTTVLAKSREVLAWLSQIGAQPVLSGQAVASARATSPAPMLPLAEGEKRLLITKIKRDGTRADMFGKGDRYPRTKLFDLGLLIPMGFDLDELPDGVEIPTYFFAVVVESQKKNKKGNFYIDCVRIESAQ